MQLDYSSTMTPGIAGTKYDNSLSRIDAFAAETAVYPGTGVVDGKVAGKQVKVPAGAVNGFRGVAMLQAKEQDMQGNVIYKVKDTVPVMNVGRVWVTVTGAVKYDDDVYLIHTGADTGKFINATGTNQGQITGAKFRTTTTGAGIAVVELK